MKNLLIRFLFLQMLTAAGILLSAFSASAEECEVVPPEGVDVTSDAYAQVVLTDAFCCNIDWDGVCQNLYNNFSGGGEDPSGNCVTPPEGVDAESPEYTMVTTAYPPCCTSSWDAFCTDLYNAYLNANQNTQCAETPPSVDTLSTAYQTVIADDPFCCTNTWDALCQQAYDSIVNGDDDEDQECVEAPASVDTESDAYAAVIAADAYCCNTAWDTACQNQYNALTGGDDDDESETPENGCAAVPDGVDINSAEYQEVIDFDSFCCNFSWDALCQINYDNLLSGDPMIGVGTSWYSWYADDYVFDYPDDGECADVPAGVDTSSTAYAEVIANDPFCCNVAWDNLCQSAYDNLTGGGMGSADGQEGIDPGETGDCIAPPDSIDTESEAYSAVIANDIFCCFFGWDILCQDAYDNFGNAEPTDPEDEECIVAPAHVDTESDAYAQTIELDPFCCNAEWDQICENLYNSLSNTSGIAAPPTAQADEKFNFNIYPNPAMNVLNINFTSVSDEEQVIIEVYNVTGQKVMQTQVISAPGQQEMMDVSVLGNGLYLINARQGNQTLTRQFVVQK